MLESAKEMEGWGCCGKVHVYEVGAIAYEDEALWTRLSKPCSCYIICKQGLFKGVCGRLIYQKHIQRP